MSAIFAAGGNPLNFLEQFGVEWQLLISQAVSFAIVATALYWFVFKPVISASDKRKQQIEQGLHDAEEAKRRLASAQAEADKKTAEAIAEASNILKSAFGNDNNIIYTPTDNTNVIMRSVMSREQALCFIDQIPDIAPLVVEHEKMRRECYRAVMACAESEGYVSLIKAAQERRAQYAKQKKRVSDVDVDYEKKAKYCLYGELSSALDIPFADVEKYISNKIN